MNHSDHGTFRIIAPTWSSRGRFVALTYTNPVSADPQVRKAIIFRSCKWWCVPFCYQSAGNAGTSSPSSHRRCISVTNAARPAADMRQSISAFSLRANKQHSVGLKRQPPSLGSAPGTIFPHVEVHNTGFRFWQPCHRELR